MSTLSEVLKLIKMAVEFIGGGLIAWGLIEIGTSIKEKNGVTMNSGIMQIAGGVLVFLAGAIFGNLTMSGGEGAIAVTLISSLFV